MTQESEPLTPHTPSPLPQRDASADTAGVLPSAIPAETERNHDEMTESPMATPMPPDGSDESVTPGTATPIPAGEPTAPTAPDARTAVPEQPAESIPTAGADAVANGPVSPSVEPIPPSIEPSYAPTGEERAARRASLASRTTPKFVAAKDDAESSQSPLVSVIVTVQDAAETVRFCVDSILRQSYANLEVILVDDGSLDDGPAILDEYAKRDDRVTTIFLKDGRRTGTEIAGTAGTREHDDNDATDTERTADSVTTPATDLAIPGIPPVVIEKSEADKAADKDAERGDVAARARNAGLDAAHGEYVAFVGSDGVLDRRNIELLLHALIKTGADMAKSRWERFTADQLYSVAEAAAGGAREPETVTVFTDALEAYQSVFLKSLRVIGDEFGHNTEARFLHDEDWGRLYRMSVWDGVRLPEGIYSPELLAAGELYSRMGKVADVDVVLYRWLREDADGERGTTHGTDGAGYESSEGITPGDATDAANNTGPVSSVSDDRTGADRTGADRTAGITGTRHPHDNDATVTQAAPRRFRYWHDTFTAGSANFRFAFERGILPARSYTTMVTAYEGAKSSPDFDEPESQRQFALDTAELEELRGMLTFKQRLQCVGVRRMRLFEEGVKRFLPSALSHSQYTPGPETTE